MSKEVELKLALAPQALPALRSNPLIAEAPLEGANGILLNTYFDTPGLELRARKIAVRMRKDGENWIQTVKCAAASLGGLASRPEWEQPSDGEHFDFSQIDAAEVRSALESVKKRLAPIFTTTFARSTRRLTPKPGVVILAMIDEGSIEAGGRSSPLCELELELVSGDPRELYALALQLAEQLPLHPEDASKAQRGYELHQNIKPSPRRARHVALDPKMPAHEAFLTLAYETLAMWQANENLALRLDDPEFVHQARVALRRFRTLISLFRDALPKPLRSRYSALFKALADSLGGARDADVVLSTLLLPITTTCKVGDDLNRLVRTLELHRDDQRKKLRSKESAAERGRAQLELAATLHSLPDADAGSISKLARRAMRRVHKKALACLAAADAGDAAQLHQLRIVLKRLRYGLDFFSALWAPNAVQAYARALATLQDGLGDINDAAMGNRLLAEVSGDDPGLAAARAFTAGWHAPRIAQLRAKALADAKTLLTSETPWKNKKEK
ncbi:CHAD domain-containing protein [Niveibacterium sp. 24ML]|uniref:CYTH and CHAD domain-containing protein n=1 Tax=Niveibacterium sp. 24ML TaxID=2985512 RepID=UPI00226EB4B8|nr:CYTH and CHAD domain-containing protein [Niveibacterium sp. 24ML]MCX9157633.1 CHAD domain-containing protein [Niveibacterium sp. 24ML]